ncbi:MAG TPA: hypothetical protein VNK46_14255 [Nitrospiraceae bacterium]|nr:hypothetical protein [Nitrospiraceae bacterium]
MDKSYEAARHAKPVRCPRCRRAAAVLLFDSRAVGMVCTHCHEALMRVRGEAAAIARDLRGAVSGRTRPVRCPRCRRLAPVLLFDSETTGMVCRRCHEQLMDSRGKAVGFAQK